jgi:hypothetical protein
MAVQVLANLAKKGDLITKIIRAARHWWLMPVILAIQEAEIRRIATESQLRQ